MTVRSVYTNPPLKYDFSGVFEYQNFRANQFFQQNAEYDVKSPNRWMKTQILLKNKEVLGEMRRKRDQNSSKKEELINGGKSFRTRSSAKDKDHNNGKGKIAVNTDFGRQERHDEACQNWISQRKQTQFYYDYYDINWNGSRRFDGIKTIYMSPSQFAFNVNHYYGCLNKTNAQRDRKICHQTVNQDSKSVFERDNYDSPTLEAAKKREKKERHRGLKVSKHPKNQEIVSKALVPSVTKVPSDGVKESLKDLDNQSNCLSEPLELYVSSGAKFNSREFPDVEQDTSTEEAELNWPPVTFYNDPYDLGEQQDILKHLKEQDEHHENRIKFLRETKEYTPSPVISYNNCSADDSFSPEVKIIFGKANLSNETQHNLGKTSTNKQPNAALGCEDRDHPQMEELSKITITLKDNIIVINKSPGKIVRVLFDD